MSDLESRVSINPAGYSADRPADHPVDIPVVNPAGPAAVADAVITLAEHLAMPIDVIASLHAVANEPASRQPSPAIMQSVRELAHPMTRVDAWTTLRTALHDANPVESSVAASAESSALASDDSPTSPSATASADPDGMHMLYWMLATAAKHTAADYRRRGIPADVFDATMACFPRFISEHRVSYGRYGFDRDFWTYRQLGSTLFRIGELEYELVDTAVDTSPFACVGLPRVIAIHIPSDARLTPALCDDSIIRARAFLTRFFPDWTGLPFVCESWLLSPALEQLLPAESRIIAFQRRFDILTTDDAAPDWREWVYQRSDAPIADLPEGTSLQRAMKRHLLAGGTIGTGTGTLCR